MRTYKARGIVLHTIKYGDSSAIAYLFTDVLGRMSYMVQGIRSKRAGATRRRFSSRCFSSNSRASNSRTRKCTASGKCAVSAR